jgi:hypothetical protein
MVYGLLLLLIDPFNLFNVGHLVGNEAKRNTALKINSVLWKIIEYRKNPKENILLGDSRMNNLKTDKIKEVSGTDYYNFAYGGGSIEEIVETVWYASKLKKLKRIYIGLAIETYNAYYYDRLNRVKEAKEILNDQFLYFSNKNVVSAAFNAAVYLFTKQSTLGIPTMSRDDFWRHQLQFAAEGYYQKYQYPDKYFKRLQEISNYCKQQQIKLGLIIFPTHVDLQKKIIEYNLINEYRRFQEDLAKIAITYDFNFENAITRNKNNFRDPFHYNQEVGELIIQEVWSKPKGLARIYGSN